ncbi:hypothetical protein LTR28_006186, partial [Elasticomyces elasticus]
VTESTLSHLHRLKVTETTLSNLHHRTHTRLLDHLRTSIRARLTIHHVRTPESTPTNVHTSIPMAFHRIVRTTPHARRRRRHHSTPTPPQYHRQYMNVLHTILHRWVQSHTRYRHRHRSIHRHHNIHCLTTAKVHHSYLLIWTQDMLSKAWRLRSTLVLRSRSTRDTIRGTRGMIGTG